MSATENELRKPPAELLEIKPRRGDGSRRSPGFCEDLCCYGGRDDYRWGFQIYRTIYYPGSDEDFKKAIATLQAYQKHECSEDVVKEEQKPEEDDDLFAYAPGIDDYTSGDDDDDDDEDEDSDDSEAEHSENQIDDEGKVIDDRANQQLWKQLQNEIVSDPSLEGASWSQL